MRFPIRRLSCLLPALFLGLVLAAPSGAGRSEPKGVGDLRWVPVEGTSHSVFASAGPHDAIDVYLSFGLPGRRPNLGAAIVEPFKAWQRELAAATGGRAVIEKRLGRRSLNVTVSGLERPVPAVDRLVEAYRDSELPLFEVFLVRRSVDASGEPADPVADPRMPRPAEYPDAGALWRAAFDAELPPPPSENPSGMLALMTFPDGQVLNETRGMPLFFEDLRIVYGTPEVDVLPPDQRSAEVAQVLRRSVVEAFPRGAAPVFFNGAKEEDRVVKVRRGERIGYSFALSRGPEAVGPLAVRYPESFRFREYELMRGVKSAIRKLDLEPVVLWHRGTLYVLNVWERMR